MKRQLAQTYDRSARLALRLERPASARVRFEAIPLRRPLLGEPDARDEDGSTLGDALFCVAASELQQGGLSASVLEQLLECTALRRRRHEASKTEEAEAELREVLGLALTVASAMRHASVGPLQQELQSLTSVPAPDGDADARVEQAVGLVMLAFSLPPTEHAQAYARLAEAKRVFVAFEASSDPVLAASADLQISALEVQLALATELPDAGVVAMLDALGQRVQTRAIPAGMRATLVEQIDSRRAFESNAAGETAAGGAHRAPRDGHYGSGAGP